MSDFVAYENVATPPTAPVWTDDPGSVDADLIDACSAARAAVQAFDQAARSGAAFGALCELSVMEQRAVRAVSAVKCSTPKGIAEKALLLECYFNSVGRRDVTEETFDVMVSLAADAVALAKTMLRRAPQRRRLAAD